MEVEAEDSKQKMEEQRKELEGKMEQLRGAEEARDRLEGTLRELRMEVKGLRNRVDLLEVERDGLRAQGENQVGGAQSGGWSGKKKGEGFIDQIPG